ncbi:unnamed protein product [Hapterophycus canaliculatus]
MSQQDESTSEEEGEEEEIARFEHDTESFLLRKREFQFVGLPPVVLHQDFVCVEGTGGAVWRPSIQFSKFVCSEEGREHLPLSGRAVLEISSGLGLSAIVAWHLGASPVVATDIDSENGPMALLARNVKQNCVRKPRAGRSPPDSLDVAPQEPTRDTGDGRRPAGAATGAARSDHSLSPRVQSLSWGDSAQLAEALANFHGFGPDVVLACDVVFDDALLPALTETLVEACCSLPTRLGTRPRLCVSHQKRNRRREDSFFSCLARRLGGGEWRMVHQQDDLLVFLFSYSEVEARGEL